MIQDIFDTATWIAEKHGQRTVRDPLGSTVLPIHHSLSGVMDISFGGDDNDNLMASTASVTGTIYYMWESDQEKFHNDINKFCE